MKKHSPFGFISIQLSDLYRRKEQTNPKRFLCVRLYVIKFVNDCAKIDIASIPLAQLNSIAPFIVFHLCYLVSVTRLIRIAYGDYKLNTIPPGMAIPVPYKPVTNQKARGSLAKRQPSKRKPKDEEKVAQPVQWVTSVQ